MAFSPNGRTLAAAGQDQKVKLWEVKTGKEWAILAGHSDTVWSVSFSPDGKTLASGSDDHTIKLWEMPNGKQANK